MVRKKVLVRKKDGQVRVIKEEASAKKEKSRENAAMERSDAYSKNAEKETDGETDKT
jgi:hypothetical protein